MKRADMHIHTYYSDGTLTPAEVVALAKQNNVEFLVVTDHDCSLCYEELFELCTRNGISTVRGIEVSAYIDDVKIHTLGYDFDSDSAVFKTFSKRLYENSLKRTEDILQKLGHEGVKMTVKEIQSHMPCKLSPIHTMHISHTAALKGYCGGDSGKFFMTYLAWGRPAFSTAFRPTPEEVIEVINACGGITSLAHPGRIDMTQDQIVDLAKRLKTCGLYAIEARYSGHKPEQTKFFSDLASECGLSVTGGSDVHFPFGSRKIGNPMYYISDKLLDVFGIQS